MYLSDIAKWRWSSNLVLILPQTFPHSLFLSCCQIRFYLRSPWVTCVIVQSFLPFCLLHSSSIQQPRVTAWNQKSNYTYTKYMWSFVSSNKMPACVPDLSSITSSHLPHHDILCATTVYGAPVPPFLSMWFLHRHPCNK